jgi:hypothetical protein
MLGQHQVGDDPLFVAHLLQVDAAGLEHQL